MDTTRFCSRTFVLAAMLALVLLPNDVTSQQTVPFWNMYKWGSNIQAWCRFHCTEKINAGLLFKIDTTGVTSDFKTFGNLKLHSQNGTSYIVETNYDIWNTDGFCQFQFGLTYTGIGLDGNCSFYEPTTGDKPRARGLDLAMWKNTYTGTQWRYQGRCSVPCSGVYRPGTLRVTIDVDKTTTNFNAYDLFTPTIPADSLARSWNVINQKDVTSSTGICNIDFEFEHQAEFPTPRGTCYVM